MNTTSKQVHKQGRSIIMFFVNMKLKTVNMTSPFFFFKLKKYSPWFYVAMDSAAIIVHVLDHCNDVFNDGNNLWSPLASDVVVGKRVSQVQVRLHVTPITAIVHNRVTCRKTSTARATNRTVLHFRSNAHLFHDQQETPS